MKACFSSKHFRLLCSFHAHTEKERESTRYLSTIINYSINLNFPVCLTLYYYYFSLACDCERGLHHKHICIQFTYTYLLLKKYNKCFPFSPEHCYGIKYSRLLLFLLRGITRVKSEKVCCCKREKCTVVLTFY